MRTVAHHLRSRAARKSHNGLLWLPAPKSEKTSCCSRPRLLFRVKQRAIYFHTRGLALDSMTLRWRRIPRRRENDEAGPELLPFRPTARRELKCFTGRRKDRPVAVSPCAPCFSSRSTEPASITKLTEGLRSERESSMRDTESRSRRRLLLHGRQKIGYVRLMPRRRDWKRG